MLYFGNVPRPTEKMQGCSLHTLTKHPDGIYVNIHSAHADTLKSRLYRAIDEARLNYSKHNQNSEQARYKICYCTFFKTLYCLDGVYLSVFPNFSEYAEKLFYNAYHQFFTVDYTYPEITYSIEEEDWISPQKFFIPYSSILTPPPKIQGKSHSISAFSQKFSQVWESLAEPGYVNTISSNNIPIQVPISSLSKAPKRLCPKYANHHIFTTKFLDYLNISEAARTRYCKNNILINICQGYWACLGEFITNIQEEA